MNEPERICETCRWWVGYDNVHAFVGECTLVLTGPGPSIRLIPTSPEVDPALVSASLTTPFDWGCVSWQEKPPADDAQSSGR